MAAPQGTGFTNLQDILNANQNNQLGSTVSSGIMNTANSAANNLNQAQNQFQQQSSANQIGTQAQQNWATNALNNAATNGTTANPSDAQQFQQYMSGQYNGPQTLNNADQISGQLQSAQQLGQLTQSEGGRQGLLQQFVGGPSYTQGQQGLDTLLLGQANLNQANRATQGLVAQGANAQNAAAQQYQTNLNQAQQFGQNLTNAVTSAQTPIQQAAQSQFAADQAAAAQQQAQYSAAQSALGGLGGFTGNVTNNAALQAVLNPTQLTQLQNTLGNYNNLYNQAQQVNQWTENNPSGYVPTAAERTVGNALGYQMGNQGGFLGIGVVKGYTPQQLATINNDINASKAQASQILQQYQPQAVLNNLANGLQYTGPQNLTASGTTTQQQAAQLGALAQLSGQANPYANATDVGQYQAGNISSNFAGPGLALTGPGVPGGGSAAPGF